MRPLFLALALIFFSSPAFSASELVYFHSEACEWCEIWDEEVGTVYGKTDEAQIAPIRRVDFYFDRPEDLKNIKGVRYTPTFVLMHNGQEIGRILGYPGESHFWGLLDALFVKLEASIQGCKKQNQITAKEGSKGVEKKTC